VVLGGQQPVLVHDDGLSRAAGRREDHGLDRIRDTLIVFTTGGIFSVANIALALTDPAGNAQQRVSRLTQDAILWGDPGIVSWGDRLIVPTLRGVILLMHQRAGGERVGRSAVRDLDADPPLRARRASSRAAPRCTTATTTCRSCRATR
jgi:hypothetical protein